MLPENDGKKERNVSECVNFSFNILWSWGPLHLIAFHFMPRKISGFAGILRRKGAVKLNEASYFNGTNLWKLQDRQKKAESTQESRGTAPSLESASTVTFQSFRLICLLESFLYWINSRAHSIRGLSLPLKVVKSVLWEQCICYVRQTLLAS